MPLKLINKANQQMRVMKTSPVEDACNQGVYMNIEDLESYLSEMIEEFSEMDESLWKSSSMKQASIGAVKLVLEKVQEGAKKITYNK